MEKQKWWGYLHVNGHIQVKRYFSEQDLDEANESPFCRKVTESFDALGRDEAIKIATDLLKSE